MPVVTAKRIAEAIKKQDSMSTEKWLAHGDELFIKQRVMFLELLTFGRDGVTAEQLKAMVDMLAVLQRVAEGLSDEASRPVEMPEFSDAVKRSYLWFQELQSGRSDELGRMVGTWAKGVQRTGEPAIWALLVNVIQENGILMAPLAEGMVITLHSIADVFSGRCGLAIVR